MCRRASASHVVVIHARQVVVDQRVGVNDFDSSTEPGCITLPSRSVIRCDDEHAAESLAASGERVRDRGTHRLGQVGGFTASDFEDSSVDSLAM
jgi:hypothetical protein